jgi:hypothetical protein
MKKVCSHIFSQNKIQNFSKFLQKNVQFLHCGSFIGLLSFYLQFKKQICGRPLSTVLYVQTNIATTSILNCHSYTDDGTLVTAAAPGTVNSRRQFRRPDPSWNSDVDATCATPRRRPRPTMAHSWAVAGRHPPSVLP